MVFIKYSEPPFHFFFEFRRMFVNINAFTSFSGLSIPTGTY